MNMLFYGLLADHSTRSSHMSNTNQHDPWFHLYFHYYNIYKIKLKTINEILNYVSHEIYKGISDHIINEPALIPII